MEAIHNLSMCEYHTLISPDKSSDDFGRDSFNRSDKIQCFLAGE